MKYRFFLLPLFIGLITCDIIAQDSSVSNEQRLKIESLPLSLEQEEEAMILERHQAKFQKGQKELQRELVQLAFDKKATDEQLFYLENQQQQSEGGHNAKSQKLNMLHKERAALLDKVAALLIESDLDENTNSAQEEDWDLAPIAYSVKLQRLNDEIRKLDTRIAVYELAIPDQIDELDDLQEQIDETKDLADQLQILQESNQELIKNLDD